MQTQPGWHKLIEPLKVYKKVMFSGYYQGRKQVFPVIIQLTIPAGVVIRQQGDKIWTPEASVDRLADPYKRRVTKYDEPRLYSCLDHSFCFDGVIRSEIFVHLHQIQAENYIYTFE